MCCTFLYIAELIFLNNIFLGCLTCCNNLFQYIKIPAPTPESPSALRVFSFYLSSDSKDQPQASFDCIHQYVSRYTLNRCKHVIFLYFWNYFLSFCWTVIICYFKKQKAKAHFFSTWILSHFFVNSSTFVNLPVIFSKHVCLIY